MPLRTSDDVGITVSARHLVENLALDLYQDPSDCLAELWRNSAVACMPQDRWTPNRVRIEINLLKSHPLSPNSPALEVMDWGCGIPRARLRVIGPGMDDSRNGKLHGAAQKRIGRFAGLALNQCCLDGDINSGYYIMTRTTKEGPVDFVSMIPAMIERGERWIKTIDPDSIELGHRKGMAGTFTCIIIPNTVFQNEAQIRDALKWRIPRSPDLMFNLKVGGKAMIPPKLGTEVTSADSGNLGIKAFLQKCSGNNGGIWLTDADTGLRVSYAPKLAPFNIPYPLWRTDVEGDIFVRNLLAYQNTSRSGLNPKYLKSSAWEKVRMYLIGHIIPQVKAMLGNDDVFDRSSATSQSVLEIADMFNRVWGDPQQNMGPLLLDGLGLGLGGNKREKLAGPPKHKENPGGGHGGGGSPGKPRKPRVSPINIAGTTYFLSKLPQDPSILASVDPTNGRVIYLNDDRYEGFPTRKDALFEHVLLMIFGAVARHLYPGDGDQMAMWVGARRAEVLLGVKSK